MTKEVIARRNFSRTGFSLVLIAAVTVLSQLILELLCTWGNERGMTFMAAEWMEWVITFVPLYLLGMPAGILLMRGIPRDGAEKSGLGVGNFFLMLLMCFPLMYFGNLLGTGLSLLLSEGNAENVLLNYAYDSGLLKTLIMVVLAPLLEEFVFRRQLIDRLARYGEKNAVVFSALCFGLFHMNLYQFFYAFALGIIFAYIYVRTRRLRYSVLMHMIINFLGAVIAPLLLSNLNLDALTALDMEIIMSLDTEAVRAMIGPIVLFVAYYLFYMACTVAGVVLLITKFREVWFVSMPCELASERRFSVVYGNAGMVVFVLLSLLMISISLY